MYLQAKMPAMASPGGCLGPETNDNWLFSLVPPSSIHLSEPQRADKELTNPARVG